MSVLICPNCEEKLYAKTKVYCCENNHSFDINKYGSVNLLLPQYKKSKDPGDNKPMVIARRDFLNAGYYLPIAESISKMIMPILTDRPFVIADSGCGEGYYLRQINKFLSLKKNINDYYGWDISKHATSLAARQADFESLWFTASNSKVPIADNSVDIILSCFGFEVASEFFRILKKESYIFTVDVGENHLIELRKIIYPKLKSYRAKEIISISGVSLEYEKSIKYKISINKCLLHSLILMTPHFYRMHSDRINYINSLEKLNLSVDVVIRCYLLIK